MARRVQSVYLTCLQKYLRHACIQFIPGPRVHISNPNFHNSYQYVIITSHVSYSSIPVTPNINIFYSIVLRFLPFTIRK